MTQQGAPGRAHVLLPNGSVYSGDWRLLSVLYGRPPLSN